MEVYQRRETVMDVGQPKVVVVEVAHVRTVFPEKWVLPHMFRTKI